MFADSNGVGFAAHIYPKQKLEKHMAELWDIMKLPEPELGQMVVNYVFGIPFTLRFPVKKPVDFTQTPRYATHLNFEVTDDNFQKFVNSVGWKWKKIASEVKDEVYKRLGEWPDEYEPPNCMGWDEDGEEDGEDGEDGEEEDDEDDEDDLEFHLFD